MRLLVTAASANEELIRLVNRGYQTLESLDVKRQELKHAGIYDDEKVAEFFGPIVNPWAEEVEQALGRIFPTELEKHKFGNPDMPFGAVSGDYNFQSLRRRLDGQDTARVLRAYGHLQ